MTAARKRAKTADPERLDEKLRIALSALEKSGTKANVDGMARYGIVASKVYGVSVGTIRKLAKPLGRDHELALALWDTGWYEARLMAAFVGDPERLTGAQMDRWARSFENWADCDTACFALFDRSPHAFGKVAAWAVRKEEFVKRGAFALLASLAGHDRTSGDEAFTRCLPLIEAAATDERNFVKKGVSWALRGIGRRSPGLNAAAVALARRLMDSTSAPARWIGRDAFRELTSPAVVKALQKRAERAKGPAARKSARHP